MASIFRQQYTAIDKNGKKVNRKSKYWYIDYKTSDGTRKRVKGFKDKTATTQFAAKLEKEAELAQNGIVDRFKEHRNRPLDEHISDFKASLMARDDTEEYVNLTVKRIQRVFSDCGFRTIQDITASRVEKAIRGLRKLVERVKIDNDGKRTNEKITKDLGPVSTKTKNYYLKAAKQFCRWLVQNQRAAENVLEHLNPKTTKTPVVRRRALELDEIAKLLDITAMQKESYGMSGPQRSLLYRLAVETGLRVSEFRSLTAESFDFNENTVTVQAAYTKNRCEAVLPLRVETVELLKDVLSNKTPQAGILNMPHKSNFANMLRDDLIAGGINPEDQGRGKVDFHSLRHTFGTLLAASGVHPKTAQELMRHSDINLTMSRYTHILRGQEAQAIAQLPDFSVMAGEQAKATGTDEKKVGQENGAYKPAYKKLTKNPYFDGQSMSAFGNTKSKKQALGKSHKSIDGAVLGKEKDQMSPSGLKRARQDSNLQPSDSKSATLSN